MSNIYTAWRFTDSPFNSTPLPASAMGDRLAAANGYCMHVADEGPSERPRQPAELDQAFSAWLEASFQKLLRGRFPHLMVDNAEPAAEQ